MPRWITGDLANTVQDDYPHNSEMKESLSRNDSVVLLDHHKDNGTEDNKLVRDPKDNKGNNR